MWTEVISGNMEGKRISHYRILRPLGSGGMGEVYAAEDERLHRQVAIKFIARRMIDTRETRRRFEREAQAASALNHPNICTIFEINDDEERPYLVMELLEGRDLRNISAAGPVEIVNLLKWGVEITDALAHAHSRGVVHRDIKPGNIFIGARGDAKILDFGIAKMEQPGSAGSSETASVPLTRRGSMVGTAAYMSPEQARGEALDGRTDLFSLGAVLYELASGKPAFDGPTPAVIFNSILSVTPASLSRIRSDLPPDLERIINKALEKDRAARYQSATEMKEDLGRLRLHLERDPTAPRSTLRVGWIAAGLTVALVMGTLVWLLARQKTQGAPGFSRRTTVAVLPFQNAGTDRDLDYLSTALPDEVITTLSYAPTLSVRPFSMSRRFIGADSDPHQAGRHMRVARVITGHYLRQAEKVAVTLEVTDVAKADVVWSGTVQTALHDALSLRQQLASVLHKGLLPALGASVSDLSVTRPQSEEAYELYLRSQDIVYTKAKDAIAVLEKSTAIDPGYAPAWVALGERYYNDADAAAGGTAMFQKAIACFERARHLDPDLLSAATWLIGARLFAGDLSVGFAEIQELARKRPRRAEVHLLLAEALRGAGALEEAARECEMTHQLDSEMWTDCSVLYIHMGDLTRARQEIDRSPGDFNSFMLGQVLLREGRTEEALPRLKLFSVGEPYDLIRDCWPSPESAQCAATTRRSEASIQATPDTDVWYFGAATFAFLGNSDAASRLLRADSERSFCIYPSVDRDTLFDRIRPSPEFKAAREAGIECQKTLARFARIQID
jgi:serine/threonine protein kinase/tetratricopeptide (TPR) repeat protein